MRAAIERLGIGFASIAGVLGVIFSISAANDSEWIGVGVCLVGSAMAFAAASYVSQHRRTS